MAHPRYSEPNTREAGWRAGLRWLAAAQKVYGNYYAALFTFWMAGDHSAALTLLWMAHVLFDVGDAVADQVEFLG
jgi:hypothetical protein